MGEGLLEEHIRRRGYIWPTLWLTSIVLVGTLGYSLGGSGTQPEFLANIGEAFSNVFGTGTSGYVEIIDLSDIEENPDPSPTIRVLEAPVYTPPVAPSGVFVDQATSTLETVEEIAEEPEEEYAVCSQDSLGKPTLEVLINEVAWAGKKERTSEEWVELYNNGGEAVSLSGWQLLSRDNSVELFFEDEALDEYLLLKRILSTDEPEGEYFVGEVPVDVVYTGVIKNSDESLRLFDEECVLVDEVEGVGSNWGNIGGSASPEYRSAERTDEGGWHTYSGNGEGGVMGTPRAENSEKKEVETNPEPEKKTYSSSSGSSSISPNAETQWCSQDDLNDPTHIAYINEVAWAGTASSSSEEWIELYTPIQGGLSMSGWQLVDKEGEIQIEFDGDIEEYLLLKRILTAQDPNGSYEVGGVEADVAYTGVMQNDDEILRLFDASCNLVDEVIDVGSSWNNIGGSASPDYETAERVDATTWRTYQGEEGTIMGTPRASNSSLDENNSEEDPPSDGEEGEEGNGDGEEGEQEEEAEVDLEITNVIYDVEGSDEGQERIFIFNNATTSVNLSGYSIQYLKEGDDFIEENEIKVRRKGFSEGDRILGEEEFVVGANCSGTPCEGVDKTWSQALGNDGGTVYLVNDQEYLTGVDDESIVSSYVYPQDSEDNEPTPDESPS